MHTDDDGCKTYKGLVDDKHPWLELLGRLVKARPISSEPFVFLLCPTRKVLIFATFKSLSQHTVVTTVTIMRSTTSSIILAAGAAIRAAAQATEFTSEYAIVALPNQVVDANNTYTGGLPGARGQYIFRLNSNTNTICYDITLEGFQGEYQSPAVTATHIHEATAGLSGPPRIAFPNPVDDGTGVRRSTGCINGTADGFVTGVTNAMTGQDQGFGFSVKQIEDNPAGFNADVHSSEAVPGAVRGQFGPAMAPSMSSSSSMSMMSSTSMMTSMMPTTMSTSMSMSDMMSGDVTVTVPCTKVCEAETSAAPVPTSMDTGMPVMPPATGGSMPPMDTATTYNPPTGPTPTSYDSGMPQPTAGYTPSQSSGMPVFTGAAARPVVEGAAAVAVGLAGMVFFV